MLLYTFRSNKTRFLWAVPFKVLARAIAKGCDNPVNDYLRMTNHKRVTIRDIDPKAVSTQELYGFVNMATREWKVRHCSRLHPPTPGDGTEGWVCVPRAATFCPSLVHTGWSAVLQYA